MDVDELFSKRPDDPLTQLLRQDLDRFEQSRSSRGA